MMPVRVDGVDRVLRLQKVRQHRYQRAGFYLINKQKARQGHKPLSMHGGKTQRISAVGKHVARNRDGLWSVGSRETPLRAVRRVAIDQAIMVGEVCRSLWCSTFGEVLGRSTHE